MNMTLPYINYFVMSTYEKTTLTHDTNALMKSFGYINTFRNQSISSLKSKNA